MFLIDSGEPAVVFNVLEEGAVSAGDGRFKMQPGAPGELILFGAQDVVVQPGGIVKRPAKPAGRQVVAWCELLEGILKGQPCLFIGCFTVSRAPCPSFAD